MFFKCNILKYIQLSDPFQIILVMYFFFFRLIHLNKIDPHAPNEMLYGQMGYIFALLFVNKNFGMEKIPQSYIQQVPCFCAFWSLFRIPLTVCLDHWFYFSS